MTGLIFYAQDVEGDATTSSSRFLDIPPELCAIIARFASRQSLARLCSVSHRLFSIFSALLYANIVDPLLSNYQSSRLIRTLSTAQTLTTPHPAILIRHLSLTGYVSDKAQVQACTEALRNMYRLVPGAETLRGSALRSLRWNLPAGLDDLGCILGARGHFPNLSELFVTSDGTNKNFNFVQVGGLQILGLDLSIPTHDDGEVGDRMCYKLAEAIQMLPITSPLLHTLHLKLDIPFNFDTFPYLGCDDLLSAMNNIRLYVLEDLEISLKFYPDYEYDMEDDELPLMDFSLFLTAHPTLAHLALSTHGPQISETVPFLPHLHSFKGSFEDAAVICARQRELDQLTLTFVHRSRFEMPSFRIERLPSQFTLMKLQVLAVDLNGAVIKRTNELSPASLTQLVSSFPNLTQLDICISGRMKQYRKSFIRLMKLQSLRVQEYRERPGLRMWPAKKVFPPADYIKEFGRFLPSLPQLECIEICILADDPDNEDSENWCSCGSCTPPGYSDLECDTPEMTVDYRFSVIRTSSSRAATVVLSSSHVS
ncbi:hypothetical protein MVEN_00580900 [Mycena venus]|uniref:F-box domain-containing protein n=1 Tax=Mycena venus TaxID=2733690 RepID=A0A8H6YJH2_9AGAR|nr:hypothetical protein MVEN_00580900 [Mycena venus]